MNGHPGDGDGIRKGNYNGKEEICTTKRNCEGIFCHAIRKESFQGYIMIGMQDFLLTYTYNSL